MIETISPAVVNIAVRSNLTGGPQTPQDELLRRFFDFEGPPGREREVEGAGSGVIVDAANGYILTNHHVVANADAITVTLLENRSLTARVVGSDEGSDLAVLQVQGTKLTSIPFGDSTRLRVGDYVVAIGNPFGFSNTVTSGIVSALGRSGLNSQAFEDFIQTDASINPGNSGGALVNLNGELVGINSAIISRTGGNVGIGFAIPVNQVREVMEQLIATGTVRRGLLGVNIQDVTPEIAATFGLPGNSGALVSQVSPDSAAERAGIQIEDVIVSINGTRLRDSGSLKNAIGLLPPGQSVAVGLIRDGREQTVTAVLGELALDRGRYGGAAAGRGNRARCRVRGRRARRQLEPERPARPRRSARRPGEPGRRARLASRRHHHQGEPGTGQDIGRSAAADGGCSRHHPRGAARRSRSARLDALAHGARRRAHARPRFPKSELLRSLLGIELRDRSGVCVERRQPDFLPTST